MKEVPQADGPPVRHGRGAIMFALAELFGEADQHSFGAADIAEPIRILVLNYFADQLCAAFA